MRQIVYKQNRKNPETGQYFYEWQPVAWFHGFTREGSTEETYTVAIIERVDGTVITVFIDNIRFINLPE